MKKSFFMVTFLLPPGSVAVFAEGADLLDVVIAGSTEGIQAAIESGDDVNAPGEGGMTPQIEAHDKDGGTAMMWAAAHNPDVNVMSALLARGAGLTALIMAARGNSPAIVDMLLDAGADATVRDSYGNTALSYAQYNAQLVNTNTLRKLREATR